MSNRVALSLLLLTLTVVVVAAILTDHSQAKPEPDNNVYTVKPGPDAQHELIGLLIRAAPGDVIELQEGTYHFDTELIVTADNITIRGKGREKTILSFKDQDLGSKGLEATGDSFVIEHLAVEDTVGNAIKVIGSNGVTFRSVRTEWTNGPSPDNGAYGLYPVQCDNVLIDDCVAIGASDAGIYVGQSRNVIVRNSRAEYNVAGIEIENTLDADVYDNVATNNTGGVLVFDMPNLQQRGQRSRVFHNKIYSNNTGNFAPPGNIVGTVPAGTGVIVNSTDHVEIFENEIYDNHTTNISIISFLINGIKFEDGTFDPYPEGIYIHDNKIYDGGENPDGQLVKEVLVPVLGSPFPDIFIDGIVDQQKLVDGKLPEELSIRFERNGDVRFANVNFSQLDLKDLEAGKKNVETEIAAYTGSLPRLSEVSLQPHPPVQSTSDPVVAAYRNAPQLLSDWKLFEGNGSEQIPAAGVVAYDLNSALFSDYASKYRFIRVPEGKSIRYHDTDNFEFPVGTVIAKTFTMEHDLNDPDQGHRLLETRIIEKLPTGWYGLAYQWNDEQTEAVLELGGGRVDVAWSHTDGKQQTNNYIIPNANQCKSCHVDDADFSPIGPKARHLNKDYEYSHGIENQLAYWTRIGLLQGAPQPDEAPQAAKYTDASSGDVNDRARAWLDINCAHCHNPEGSARTSGLNLYAGEDNPTKFGVWKSPVAAGRGSGGRRYDIVPGHPDKSILMYRIESSEPGVMMPELPRRLVDEEAVALIREWIQQMPDQKK